MKVQRKIVLNVSNDLKNKVLEETLKRQKQTEKRFTQTDLIVELLENYFKKQAKAKKAQADLFENLLKNENNEA